MFLVKLLTQVKIIIDYYCENHPLSCNNKKLKMPLKQKYIKT